MDDQNRKRRQPCPSSAYEDMQYDSDDEENIDVEQPKVNKPKKPCGPRTNMMFHVYSKFTAVDEDPAKIERQQNDDAYHNFCLKHYGAFNDAFHDQHGRDALFTDMSKDMNVQNAFAAHQDGKHYNHLLCPMDFLLDGQ